MTTNNSVTTFDKLSTEILLDIFEYLSNNDIIYAFYNINQRFNSILLKNQHFLNNFEISRRLNFPFWEGILSYIGPSIEHVIIRDDDIEFSLNLFDNVKSLIICCKLPINLDKLYSILINEQFNKLNSFRIKSQIFNEIIENETIERILLKRIFNNENSLEIFECSLEFSLEKLDNMVNYLNTNVNLHSLSLKLINFIDIYFLLQYLPNLKSFNLIINSFEKNHNLNKQFYLSNIKLEKFYLTYQNNNYNSTINEKDFLLLTNFLKEFSFSLIYLSINLNEIGIKETNEFQFNGILLEKQFLKSMIKLKKFYFYIKLVKERIDMELILSTFKNKFWFDHNWSIGINQNYLFTLPFHFNQFICSIDLSHLNCDDHLWNHIKSIHLLSSCKLSLNLIKQIKLNMPNLISINLSRFHHEFSQLIEQYQTNQTDIKLNSITTVHCGYESIDDLKQWLFYILPNVKRLVLSYDCVSMINLNLGRLYSKLFNSYSYTEFIIPDYNHFQNIKYVEIKFVVSNGHNSSERDPLKEILEVFQNLNNFNNLIFHFCDGSNEPYIDMSKLITLLTMDKYFENYYIKHSYNYIQFIKKEQQ